MPPKADVAPAADFRLLVTHMRHLHDREFSISDLRDAAGLAGAN
jgi:hypothetical protein